MLSLPILSVSFSPRFLLSFLHFNFCLRSSFLPLLFSSFSPSSKHFPFYFSLIFLLLLFLLSSLYLICPSLFSVPFSLRCCVSFPFHLHSRIFLSYFLTFALSINPRLHTSIFFLSSILFLPSLACLVCFSFSPSAPIFTTYFISFSPVVSPHLRHLSFLCPVISFSHPLSSNVVLCHPLL